MEGGRGGVVGEAAKLGVQLLQKTRTPSTALGLPVTPKQSGSSIKIGVLDPISNQHEDIQVAYVAT